MNIYKLNIYKLIKEMFFDPDPNYNIKQSDQSKSLGFSPKIHEALMRSEEYIRGLEMKFFSTPHDLLKKTRKKHENTRKKHENTDANFLEQSFNTDIPEQGHEGR